MEVGADAATATALMQRMSANALPAESKHPPLPSPTGKGDDPPTTSPAGEGLGQVKDTTKEADPNPTPKPAASKKKPKPKVKPPVPR